MKKFAILALVAAMFVSPLMSTVQAMEPFKKPAEVTEGRRGGRHDRGRRHRRGGSGGAIAAGAILGGLLIGGLIANSSKPKAPKMYCDAYGNCYYR